MNRITRVLSQIQEKEISIQEFQNLICEGGGFVNFPNVMDLMDAINKEQNNPTGFSRARMSIVHTGEDSVRISVLNKGTPVMRIEMSLPGVVSLLSQMKL